MNDHNASPIESASPAELAKGLRAGRTFHLFTPGLKQAARDLILALIERMEGGRSNPPYLREV